MDEIEIEASDHGTRVTKTDWIFCNSVKIGPTLRITEITVNCFKFSEKDKNKKICKTTRSNPNVTVEEIFIKPSRLCW
jgi:hypothetical protein